jgi:hypothetical protein
VAPHELPEAVPPARRTGLDRLVLEVPLDVPGQSARRLVAARAILLERPHHDPVQLAPHLAGQPGGIGAALRRQAVERVGGAREPRAGLLRVHLADQPERLGEGGRAPQRGGLERRAADEELVEQDPEGVDVRPRVDVPGDVRLLRAHVLERPHDLSQLGVHRAVDEPLVQRLGHAEVDDLRHRLALLDRDQHVRRLDVAMEDALLVGVLDGVADRQEQPEALGDGGLPLVAVLRQRHALDQLHREVGHARLGGARVEHGGDVRVAHQGQCLALRLEALQELLGVEAHPDHLQGHPAPDRLGLLGDPDGAHAALAQLLAQPVRSDADLGRGRLGFLVGAQGLQARDERVGLRRLAW